MISAPIQLIPTVPLSKTLFIVFNYIIVGMFVLMNLYITYQIVRSYGPVLLSLFTGEETAELETRSSEPLFDFSPKTRSAFGLALMVVGGLLTASIIGMIYGIPLFMIGWDIRQRVTEESEEQKRAATT